MAKCQLCRGREAIWAQQDLGDGPVYTFLGSHYRGFKVAKLCDECKECLQYRATLSQEVTR